MSNFQFITDADPREIDLADDLRLQVYSQIENNHRPVRYRVIYQPDSHAGTPLLEATPIGGAFDSESERARLAADIGALYPGETPADSISAAFESAVEALGEDVTDGSVLLADERTALVIKSTASVEFDPEARKEWSVTFTDEYNNTASFGTVTSEISADAFAKGTDDRTGSVGNAVPDSLGMGVFRKDGRWPVVRRAWIQMAADTEAEQ